MFTPNYYEKLQNKYQI